LNCKLDGATLVPEMRKPFDVLAEGLLSEKSRGNWTAIELFCLGIAQWSEYVHASLRHLFCRAFDMFEEPRQSRVIGQT
jgi:hypothetical protein